MAKRLTWWGGWLMLLAVSGSGTASASDRVSLQLRWDHQYQFAGYYAAQWMGYFSAVDLEVEIRPGVREDTTPIDVTEEVASGRAQFGIGSADVLTAKDRGEDLVFVGAIFQRSAAALFSLTTTPMEKPADLPRLKVARNRTDLVDVELRAMLATTGVDAALVPAHAVHGDLLDDLAAGRVDAIPGYAISIPYLAARRGLSLRTLRPRDFGIDFYGDSLFTHGDLARRDPALVQRFHRAVLQGWAYALDHPEEIATRIVHEYPGTRPPEEALRYNLFQAGLVATLVDRWRLTDYATNPLLLRRMHEQLLQLGVVKRAYDPGFLFDPEALQRANRTRTAWLAQRAAAVALGLTFIAAIFWTALHYLVRRRTQRLAASEQRFRDFAEASSDWLWEQDGELRFTWISPSHDRSAGVARQDRLGLRRDDVRVPTPEETDWQQHQRDLAMRRPFRGLIYAYLDGAGALRWTEVNGVPVHDERGAFVGYRGSAHDATERVIGRRRAQAQAEHDPLTDLPNRRAFKNRLRALFGLATRGLSDCWVVLIDLDGFKNVNDTAGHRAGDELLMLWAERMLSVVRSEDLVARFGGDEFAILLSRGDRMIVETIATRMVEAASRPFELPSGSFAIGCSIGVAGCREHDSSVDDLVGAADQALYEAKAQGGGQVVFASDRHRATATRLLSDDRHGGGA